MCIPVGQRGEALQGPVSHVVVVLIGQKAAQALNALPQALLMGFHFGTEPGHHGHGGVQGVLVDQAAVVPNEPEDTGEATGLKDGAGLAGTNQFKNFDTLFREVFGCTRFVQISND